MKVRMQAVTTETDNESRVRSFNMVHVDGFFEALIEGSKQHENVLSVARAAGRDYKRSTDRTAHTADGWSLLTSVVREPN